MRLLPARALAAGAAALAVTALVMLAPPARAKEHTAACSLLPSIIDRLRGALVLAAFHRARGSSLAAYETLRTTAASISDDPAAAACGVVPGVLARAQDRAGGETTALAASLQLDQGIAAALSVALTGTISGPQAAKLIDVGESAEYGAACPDLFVLVRNLIAPPAGARRPPPELLASRVEALVTELRARGRCPAVSALLAAAAQHERTEPGASDLAHAVDSLRLDEPDQPGDGQNPVARCPELPLVIQRIADAISIGAPLYNKGDATGCRDLYRSVARRLRDEVIPAGRCPGARTELDSALTAAAQANDPGEAAWALRHGFDSITERWREPVK